MAVILTKNHWLVTDKTSDQTISDVPFLNPTDALAIDIKMDDGLPFNGNVRGTMPIEPRGTNNSSGAYIPGENTDSLCVVDYTSAGNNL